LTIPHLLEQGINNMASSMAQASAGAAKMVKSKSMEVVQAVSGDLNEVKDSIGQYTAPIGKAGGALKNTLKEIDEITDEMAESAITGVSKGASSLWNMASGYASQMFTEEDLEATAVMVETTMNQSFLIVSKHSFMHCPVTRKPLPRIRILPIVPLKSGQLG